MAQPAYRMPAACRLLAGVLGLSAGAAMAAGAYDCQLPGGAALLVVGADIAQRFPSIGSSCNAAAWTPARDVALPGWPDTSSIAATRVIHAPVPRDIYAPTAGA
ncbi:lytic transglycosylase domain-containing protein, partial [Acidovorax cattleyae]|nr:lytic transglycosylase domain-containing protein [Paracidovorax cattleyae]